MLTVAPEALKLILNNALTRQIQKGGFGLRYPDGTLWFFGTKTKGPLIEFDRWSDIQALIVNPSLGFGDANTAGHVHYETEEDLERFITTMIINRPTGALTRASRALRPRRLNSRWFQGANIARHYDGESPNIQRWYKLVLGKTRMYSCARFLDSTTTLDDAQMEKVLDIGRKLGLKVPVTTDEMLANAQLRFLDIGSGWGWAACQLAKVFGVRVHGITLAEGQMIPSRQLANRLGVTHLVTFQLVGWQEFERTHLNEGRRPFDGGYSIGMFEHVPHLEYRRYFRAVRHLIKPDGRFLLHCITNQRGGAPDQFSARRIFPGSRLGSRWQIGRAAALSGLWAWDEENLAHHYAITLRHWINNHHRHKEEIIQLLGEDFWRQRNYWLVAGMLSMRWADLSLTQLLLTNGKPQEWPLSRRYLYDQAIRHGLTV